jgi:hypothetical protein
MLISGCGSLLEQASSLEDDELYLSRDEEFVTDAEYLAYAYEQAGYDDGQLDSRFGDDFASSFGYVPQSLRGRTMLRGYLTPYGAAGFGPNPYDPFGSNFFGSFDPYNTWGGMAASPWGYNPMLGSGWGMNPYMGNSWGYNPYAFNPYGYNPYGFGGFGGYGTSVYGWNNAWVDEGAASSVIVASRTPIWSSTGVHSNGGSGRLLTNKSMANPNLSRSGGTGGAVSGKTPAPTDWSGRNANPVKSARSSNSDRNNSWNSSSRQQQWSGQSTRNSSTRGTSQGSFNSAPRSNSSSTRGSSGGNTNRGSGNRPSSGRGGQRN